MRDYLNLRVKEREYNRNGQYIKDPADYYILGVLDIKDTKNRKVV